VWGARSADWAPSHSGEPRGCLRAFPIPLTVTRLRNVLSEEGEFPTAQEQLEREKHLCGPPRARRNTIAATFILDLPGNYRPIFADRDVTARVRSR